MMLLFLPLPIDALAMQVQDVLTQVGEALNIEGPWLIKQGIRALVLAVLVAMALYVAKVIMRRVERGIVEETGELPNEDTQRKRTVAQLTYSVARISIIAIGILLILNLFFPIGPLLAGLGVFGLAISFGAQSLVKDIISGFFMLSEKQFDIGDVVEIAGTSGVVEKMTLRVVALRDIEGALHIIPNGTITKISNKTKSWSRVVLDVGVAYQEDIDRVIQVLEGIGETFTEDAKWSAMILDYQVAGVQALADNSVNIRIMATTHPGKQWEVQRELRRRIKKQFDTEGVEIPFPQRTVHLRAGEGDGASKRTGDRA